jgi:PAS domain S-box-containing protein
MTIRMKSLLLVLGTALVLSVTGVVLVLTCVLQRFAELERRDADMAIATLRQGVAAALQAQHTTAVQWSSWDDAYRFVQDRNPEFIAKNLLPSANRDSRVATIAYLDLGGNLLGSATTRPAAQGPLPAGLFALIPGVFDRIRAKKDLVGLMAVDGTVYSLVITPVVPDSDSQLPPKGICVTLREVDAAVTAEFSSALQVPVTISAGARFADDQGVEEVDDDRLRCHVGFAGLDGRRAGVATFELPRPVHRLGRQTMQQLLVTGILSLGVICILLLWQLERAVLRRVVVLGREIDAQERDPSVRISVAGNDEIAYLAGVIDRTVVRQREAAERAEASQQRYRMLFQRSADAILVVDGDEILDVNRAAARLFGAPSRRALIATPFSKLVDGSTRPIGMANEESGSKPLVPRAGKTSSDKLSEWTMYALDGRVVQAEVREAVVEIDGREAVQVLVRDVTERRVAEAERRLLAGLIEATSDCVVVADAKGRTAFLNGAARDQLGIPESENVSRQLVADLFTAPSRIALREAAMPMALARGVWRGETELLSRDGRVFPASQVLVAVTDDAGMVTHLGSLLRDISVERERESQLVKARSLAEDAARAKSSFLAIMSHELRTPLNGVIGMSSLLQESELSAEHRELVDTIKLCADNLLSLINDILDLSKIEAGGMELERTSFDLRELVESAVMIVAEGAMTKGLEIGALVDPALPERVTGDPTRLRQVLINLLGNAVKFTERGEVVVSAHLVESTSEDPAGSVRIAFSVRDSGIGIDPEILPRLFQPFVQGDDSTTRKHGGTGLGLAISHRLVTSMGGAFQVESRPGVGSTFTCIVPLPVVASEPTSLPPLSDLVVLLADPKPVARQIVASLLRGWQVRVIEVATIRQAVEAVRSGRVDLLLCAQVFDDGPVSELVRVLRAEAAGNSLGIALLVPAFVRQKDQLLTDSGADALVVKPVRHAQLRQVVQELAARGGDGRPSPVVLPVTAGVITGKRVLVVEDNPTNRMLALRILEVLGLVGSAVGSGSEALDTLATQTFDIVLMDCQMPELDGLETTRLFREREARATSLMRRNNAGHQLPRAVIVAVTAHAMAGDRERCLAAGMDDYLSKPYTIDDLKKMLERWLCR